MSPGCSEPTCRGRPSAARGGGWAQGPRKAGWGPALPMMINVGFVDGRQHGPEKPDESLRTKAPLDVAVEKRSLQSPGLGLLASVSPSARRCGQPPKINHTDASPSEERAEGSRRRRKTPNLPRRARLALWNEKQMWGKRVGVPGSGAGSGLDRTAKGDAGLWGQGGPTGGERGPRGRDTAGHPRRDPAGPDKGSVEGPGRLLCRQENRGVRRAGSERRLTPHPALRLQSPRGRSL